MSEDDLQFKRLTCILEFYNLSLFILNELFQIAKEVLKLILTIKYCSLQDVIQKLPTRLFPLLFLF